MNTADKLFAIESIKQLKARYFRFLDTRDWGGLSDIFAQDAVFDARAANGTNTELPSDMVKDSANWLYTGCDTIVDFIQTATANTYTAHHGHCHEIYILSESEAYGKIAMEDRIWSKLGSSDSLLMHGYGHYEETYTCRENIWQIQTSKLTRLNVIL